MTKSQILKNNLFWGFILWLIGWVLGIAFFMTPLKNIMGWIINPIGIVITLWVLFKKIDREKYSEYFYVALIWTIMAIVLDYFFNVLLFNIGLSYYKLDIFVYYAATLLLPLIVGTYKMKKVKQ
jgi:hypothetical protein